MDEFVEEAVRVLRRQADMLESGEAELMSLSSTGSSSSGRHDVLTVDTDPWSRVLELEAYRVNSDGNGGDEVRLQSDSDDGTQFWTPAPRGAFRIGDRVLLKTRRVE